MPPSMDEEINAALQEFNKQEEEYNTKKVIKKERNSSGMAAFLVKHSGGVIATEKDAGYVLLIGAISLIIFSIFLYVNKRPTGNYAPLRLPTPYEEGRL